MSEVRTNSITDAAGTGAPDFPNGIEVADGQNILIGTDSGDPFNANSRIRVQGTGDEWIQIKSDGTGAVGLLLGDTTDDFTAGVLSDQADGANLRFYANNAERMRIDSSGNVGIGTATPTETLQVVGNLLVGVDSGDPFSTGAKIRVQGVGAEYVQIKSDGTGSVGILFGDTTDDFTAGVLSDQTDGNNLIFHAGNAERVRITSTGNVGIGTASPDFPLDVSSTGVGSTIISRFYINDGTVGLLRVANSTTGDGSTAPSFGSNGTDAVIHTNNTEKLRVTSGGVLQFNSGYGSVAPAYGCRAWVNFDGTGTVAIRGSGNVSSITDLGTGAYRVNFATAMPDANYAVATSGEGYTLDAAGALQGPSTYSLSTSSFSLACGSNTNSRGGDWPTVSAVVFR